MRKNIFTYIALLLLGMGSINAQTQFSFYNLGDYVQQTQNVSPVYLQQNGFSLGLGVGLGLETGFEIKDLIVANDDGITNRFDLVNLHNSLEKDNNLNLDIAVNLLSMGFKTNQGTISVFANARVKNYFDYTDDFIGVIAKGINDFDLVNNRINTMAYTEIGVGYTHKFMEDKLAVGVRLKYLNGIANASTEKDATGSLTINPLDYSWTINTQNAIVNTSMIANSADNFEDGSFFTDNTGFGIDIGATYKIDEKFTVELAINDLGSINWKQDVANYFVQDQTGTVYSGINLDDEDGDIAEAMVDRIGDLVAADESTNSYKTSLVATSYTSVKYQLDPLNAFNFTVFNNYAFGQVDPDIAIGYQRTLKRTTFGLLAATGGHQGGINLGANFVLKAGPFQLYAASDNLLAMFKKPEEISGATVNFGLNFVFGYKSKKNKVALEACMGEEVEVEGVIESVSTEDSENIDAKADAMGEKLEQVIESVSTEDTENTDTKADAMSEEVEVEEVIESVSTEDTESTDTKADAIDEKLEKVIETNTAN
ncbi:MAG: DUF5723 family protein [Flavicella sp.]